MISGRVLTAIKELEKLEKIELVKLDCIFSKFKRKRKKIAIIQIKCLYMDQFENGVFSEVRDTHRLTPMQHSKFCNLNFQNSALEIKDSYIEDLMYSIMLFDAAYVEEQEG